VVTVSYVRLYFFQQGECIAVTAENTFLVEFAFIYLIYILIDDSVSSSECRGQYDRIINELKSIWEEDSFA
jgi:hypothetical protein